MDIEHDDDEEDDDDYEYSDEEESSDEDEDEKKWENYDLHIYLGGTLSFIMCVNWNILYLPNFVGP